MAIQFADQQTGAIASFARQRLKHPCRATRTPRRLRPASPCFATPRLLACPARHCGQTCRPKSRNCWQEWTRGDNRGAGARSSHARKLPHCASSGQGQACLASLWRGAENGIRGHGVRDAGAFPGVYSSPGCHSSCASALPDQRCRPEKSLQDQRHRRCTSRPDKAMTSRCRDDTP